MKQNPTVSPRAEVAAPFGMPQQYWIPSSAAASESTLQHLVHSASVQAEGENSSGMGTSMATAAKKAVEAVKKATEG